MTVDDAYNDGYTHEVLHTAHVLASTWGEHIVETRCASEFPDVKAAALKVEEAMGDFYQLVGQKFRDVESPHTADKRGGE